MRRIPHWIVVLSLALLLSACGDKEKIDKKVEETTQLQVNTEVVKEEPLQQSNKADNEQKGFLLVGVKGVMFIQWTELDSQLVGQIQTLSVSDGKTVET